MLALSTNIGRTSEDRFVALPEAGVNVGYQLTKRLRVVGGYTFLYLPQVARSGEQISMQVNPSFIPGGPAAPVGGACAAAVVRSFGLVDSGGECGDGAAVLIR